jgi:hypothetical protein
MRGRVKLSHRGRAMAIREADLWLRIQRLEDIALGLNRDRVAWEKAEDPLLYLERRAYLAAIRTALQGVEDARVVLAKACQRMDTERRRGRDDHDDATATDRTETGA